MNEPLSRLASHAQPRPPQCQIPPVPRHQNPLHPEICLSSIRTTPPSLPSYLPEKPRYPADGRGTWDWGPGTGRIYLGALSLLSRTRIPQLVRTQARVCRPAGFPRVQSTRTHTHTRVSRTRRISPTVEGGTSCLSEGEACPGYSHHISYLPSPGNKKPQQKCGRAGERNHSTTISTRVEWLLHVDSSGYYFHPPSLASCVKLVRYPA